MALLQRNPGRHVTRQLERPAVVTVNRHQPGTVAVALTDTHNAAVQSYGSNSGGYHAFNPRTLATEGVHDGVGGYPPDTVVTRLSWGRIDTRLAQRLLEGDGWIGEDGELRG